VDNQVTVTSDKVIEYLDAFGLSGKLEPNEKKQFISVAIAYGLDPFKREIYCVPYGKGEKRKLSIITGYETYLKRADRTGKLAGWKAWTEGTFELKTIKKTGYNGDYETRRPVGDMKAIVEIHRAGWQAPFVHEVYLDEYAQENDMWASKTRTMLKKVATAQAFRLCFPDEMGGLPYTSDELPDNMTRNVTPEVQQIEGKQTVTESATSVQAVVAESPAETPENLAWAEWKANKYPSVRDGITESMKALGYSKDSIRAVGESMKTMIEGRDSRSLEDLQAGLYEKVQSMEIDEEAKELF